MTDVTINATFDGSTDVPNDGGFVSWSSSSRIDRYSAFVDAGGDTFFFNGTLTGQDWRIRSMGVGEENQKHEFTLVDANANTGRRIETLTVDGEVDISLLSTRIDYARFFGDGTADHVIDIGTGRMKFIEAEGATTTITTGNDFVQQIVVNSGAGTINVGSGGVESINLADANDTVVLDGFVEAMRTDGGNDSVTVNSDANSIRTSDGEDTVNINSNGNVNFVETGQDADTVNITGSNARIGSLDTDDGNDIINIDAGNVTSLISGNGNDTLTLTNGARVNQLRDWGGTDTISLSGDSRIESLFLENNNTITLNDTSRIFQMKLDSGFNTITSANGFLESIVGYEVSSDINIGDGIGQLTLFSDTAQTHTIVLNGFSGTLNLSDRTSDGSDDQTTDLTVNGGMDFARLGNGDNTVTTGTEFVDTIQTGIGMDTVTLGSGGMRFLRTNDGNDMVIGGSAFATTIRTDGGDDTVTFDDGGASLIRTGSGADTVVVGAGGTRYIRTDDGNDDVTTGAGGVETISTGEGNDIVRLGSGGAPIVRLEAGNDKIRLTNVDDIAVRIDAGDGVDQVIFEEFTSGVLVNLKKSGFMQNVSGGPVDIENPGDGLFELTSFENVIGSNFADTLVGDGNANRLFGRDGNDVMRGGDKADQLFGDAGMDELFGGAGQDRLDGGADNDILKGNGGPDTFIFGANSGTDTVLDFLQGDDMFEISDHTGGFAALTITDQGGDRKVDHDGGTILLAGQAGLALTSADFDFV